MLNLALIAIGGALGSILRYLSSEIFTNLSRVQQLSSQFPMATFFVNAAGSLLAGIIYYFVIRNFDSFDVRLKNFLFVGFLGGFTTFSAFSLDFFRLFTAGQYPQAFIYVVSSVTLSILALFFGFYSMKIIFS
jgi:CrcB protein